VINQQIVLNEMDEMVIDMHTKNRLFAEVIKSSYVASEVDRSLSNILRRSHLFPDWSVKPILGGSSITFERNWLKTHFPMTFECLHYRSLDVSSFKEAWKRWYPVDYPMEESDSDHRALSDIRASIAELRGYRDFIDTKS